MSRLDGFIWINTLLPNFDALTETYAHDDTPFFHRYHIERHL